MGLSLSFVLGIRWKGSRLVGGWLMGTNKEADTPARFIDHLYANRLCKNALTFSPLRNCRRFRNRKGFDFIPSRCTSEWPRRYPGREDIFWLTEKWSKRCAGVHGSCFRKNRQGPISFATRVCSYVPGHFLVSSRWNADSDRRYRPW